MPVFSELVCSGPVIMTACLTPHAALVSPYPAALQLLVKPSPRFKCDTCTSWKEDSMHK